LLNIYNLSSASRHVKRGRRVHYGNVVVLQPLSAAASSLQHPLASHQCTIWIKFLTSKLVIMKFYYCCWQLKQLRA